jgi:hypothetical protein
MTGVKIEGRRKNMVREPARVSERHSFSMSRGSHGERKLLNTSCTKWPPAMISTSPVRNRTDNPVSASGDAGVVLVFEADTK